VVAPAIQQGCRGGKSELYRARRSLATTGGDPKESATERETTCPPSAGVKGEKLRVGSEDFLILSMDLLTSGQSPGGKG
jgi:hypothetical protein